MPTTTIPLRDLIGLFAGDDTTDGYPTQALAALICARARPASTRELRIVIYGTDIPPEEIGRDERRAMRLGHAAWIAAGRPTG